MFGVVIGREPYHGQKEAEKAPAGVLALAVNGAFIEGKLTRLQVPSVL